MENGLLKVNNKLTNNKMFTPQQCQNLLALINRVQLNGTEAEIVVELKAILMAELKKNPPKVEDNKEKVDNKN